MEIEHTTYIPKNVLVTGGAGFIGAAVVIHLVKNYPQYKIINFDKLDYCSSLYRLSEVESLSNYKFIKGNICSGDFVSHVLQSENIDTILHFAAQTHVDNSFGNSLVFTENNIMGTHMLLEAAKVYGIKKFIHVSTDEVYGEAGTEGFETEKHTESTLLQPSNPYAATKAGAEFLVQAYNRSFALPTIITRGNNVYGPGQYPEKIIPKFICLLENKKPCWIHGKGTNKRSYIYISDVVQAFDIILHRGRVGKFSSFIKNNKTVCLGEIYNIGTHEEVANIDVAKNLIEIFGYDQESYLKFVEDRLFNDFRYALNFDKLTALGWRAQVSWSEGLRKTILWYKGKSIQDWWGDYQNSLVAHPRARIFSV